MKSLQVPQDNASVLWATRDPYDDTQVCIFSGLHFLCGAARSTAKPDYSWQLLTVLKCSGLCGMFYGSLPGWTLQCPIYWQVSSLLNNIKHLCTSCSAHKNNSLGLFCADNIWWSPINGTIASHPNPEAPRCLPCHHAKPNGQPFKL